MKKWFLCMLSLIMLCGMTAQAAECRTGGDLHQYWYTENGHEYPYPDYVCGMYSTDGTGRNVTIMLTKDAAGRAGKEEILAMVEDDSTITFTYGAYSYRELRDVHSEMDQLIPAMYQNSASWGVGESKNAVVLDIDLKAEGAEAVVAECFRRFGDKILVNDIEGLTITLAAAQEMGIVEEIVTPAKGGPSQSYWLWGLCIVIVGAAGLWMMQQRRRVWQPEQGTVTQRTHVSRRKAEQMVADQVVTPKDRVFEDTMKKIEQE